MRQCQLIGLPHSTFYYTPISVTTTELDLMQQFEQFHFEHLIERFWRTLKWEETYLKRYENVRELENGVGAFMRFYNEERKHSSLLYRNPSLVYFGG